MNLYLKVRLAHRISSSSYKRDGFLLTIIAEAVGHSPKSYKSLGFGPFRGIEVAGMFVGTSFQSEAILQNGSQGRDADKEP